MLKVIIDVLDHYPDGDPIVLLQPTQPLRTAAQVEQAIALLTIERTSVVTVTETPDGWALERDGTAYVFWRSTIQKFGHIYGDHVHLLFIPASRTVNINTPNDWADAERRITGV